MDAVKMVLLFPGHAAAEVGLSVRTNTWSMALSHVLVTWTRGAVAATSCYCNPGELRRPPPLGARLPHCWKSLVPLAPRLHLRRRAVARCFMVILLGMGPDVYYILSAVIHLNTA
ncbi:hypothetical protein V5799_033903 [Amblyomma americanum]|uniref:Uncharacterized protein n=1 Tax=Amblyomma americanum TaxID=6943 RepID=A0AAQ4DLZ7_AMBAM